MLYSLVRTLTSHGANNGSNPFRDANQHIKNLASSSGNPGTFAHSCAVLPIPITACVNRPFSENTSEKLVNG